MYESPCPCKVNGSSWGDLPFLRRCRKREQCCRKRQQHRNEQHGAVSEWLRELRRDSSALHLRNTAESGSSRDRGHHVKRFTAFQSATGDGHSFEQNPCISSTLRLTSDSVSWPRFDNPRDVSVTPQTMSGLPGAPSGTASQTI